LLKQGFGGRRHLRAELHDVIRHARELHDLLSEQVCAADLGVIDRLRAVCDAMGDNVRRLRRAHEPPALV
jgi:hypothetical protein